MKKKALFLVLALWMSWIGCYADEGMWIPMLLKKYNICLLYTSEAADE